MSKKNNVRLVLLHVELEQDIPDLDAFIAHRAGAMQNVALATVVEMNPTHMAVNIAGKPKRVFENVEELLNTSFK